MLKNSKLYRQFFGEHAANIISEVTLKRKSENGEDHYVKKAKINEERTKNVSTCMNSKSKPGW